MKLVNPLSNKYLTLSILLYLCLKRYCIQKELLLVAEQLSHRAQCRRVKKRIKWSDLQERISDVHFRRMFRMNRKCFNLLCQKIIAAIGERGFKSEAYIDAFLEGEDLIYNRSKQLHQANKLTTGGYICGEIKLAITLRMLAGGKALDLAVIFDISESHCKKIFIDVAENWIIKADIGEINVESYLKDEIKMKKVSDGFSQRSNGILKGAIGAIDGWLVRITKPLKNRDGVRNPSTFFSRKGFYALNVQCMVDHEKKVLWSSFSNAGSSHDSSCFRSTLLYKDILKPMRDRLYELKYFILGDSAYAIESFVIPPYDNAKSGSPEDDFNFYHSSARITVECAFGEIDRRWGIFWSTISYSLRNTCIICEAGFRIHNFLVKFINRLKDSNEETNLENEIFLNDQVDNAVISRAITSDSIRPRGRPTNEEIMARMNGVLMRNHLKTLLAEQNMHRQRRDR